jgi:hypothetical protein
LSHNFSPFLGWVFFKIGSCELFAQDWLQITILLISAFWVARITSMSHQHPASSLCDISPWL